MDFRVGLGHDSHRLVRNRKLILGGVEIDFERGLVGHSDADALLHAITDAILGAAGLGDIGQWFSDNDPRWRGADSAKLLAEVLKEVGGRGWRIVNVDCTVFAEQPKLAPHRVAIQNRIAELLSIPAESINVKAKTGEGVGPVGRQECIEASAAVLLHRD